MDGCLSLEPALLPDSREREFGGLGLGQVTTLVQSSVVGCVKTSAYVFEVTYDCWLHLRLGVSSQRKRLFVIWADSLKVPTTLGVRNKAH